MTSTLGWRAASSVENSCRRKSPRKPLGPGAEPRGKCMTARRTSSSVSSPPRRELPDRRRGKLRPHSGLDLRIIWCQDQWQLAGPARRHHQECCGFRLCCRPLAWTHPTKSVALQAPSVRADWPRCCGCVAAWLCPRQGRQAGFGEHPELDPCQPALPALCRVSRPSRVLPGIIAVVLADSSRTTKKFPCSQREQAFSENFSSNDGRGTSVVEAWEGVENCSNLCV